MLVRRQRWSRGPGATRQFLLGQARTDPAPDQPGGSTDLTGILSCPGGSACSRLASCPMLPVAVTASTAWMPRVPGCPCQPVTTRGAGPQSLPRVKVADVLGAALIYV